MFSALHPLLLWGVAAVSVPLVIHLMLRQRPRPRPWAAMRWLALAMQAAQRKYKLTNLLLLLLRCLIIALAALAVARPNLAGLGRGGRLVLVVDASASMAARGEDPGPLAAARAALGAARLPERVALVAVAGDARLIADGGPRDALEALGRLEASELPGGVDRAADARSGAELIGALTPDSDVVVISDFQQDDGGLLDAALKDRCRTRVRWAVGAPAENAVIAGVAQLPDLAPGQPGEVQLRVLGESRGARIAVDGAPAEPATLTGDGELRRLALPPLTAGAHRLAIELVDRGLAYDNRLELPVVARGELPTIAVQNAVDYLGAALAADNPNFSFAALSPLQLPARALPAHGLVALRAPVSEGARLAGWVTRDGGVLWAQRELLANDPALAPLIGGLALGDASQAGGAVTSGEPDLDAALSLARIERAPTATLPEGAEVLLRAGDAPIVVALPSGAGWTVVELVALGDDREFAARGTTPLWVRRVVRRLVARVGQPQLWQAGTPAPAAGRLLRPGAAVNALAGEPLMAAPGAWQRERADGERQDVVVLPNRAEGRIDRKPPSGALRDVAAALPRPRGADWGLPLLAAALIALIGEGLLAAWAGRLYGR